MPQDKVDELKPCPFCGSDDLLASEMSVNCRGCLAEMPYLSLEETTIDRWNTRPSPPVEQMRELIERARKVATCVYIAVEKTVADDIADCIHKLIEALSTPRHAVSGYRQACDDFQATLSAQPMGEEQLAVVVHIARFRDGRPTPWEGEDRHDKEYCRRIARAVMAAYRPAHMGEEARERALEEAAKVAETYHHGTMLGSVGGNIARHIRALSSTPAPGLDSGNG